MMIMIMILWWELNDSNGIFLGCKYVDFDDKSFQGLSLCLKDTNWHYVGSSDDRLEINMPQAINLPVLAIKILQSC